jgi:hypothetical protein
LASAFCPEYHTVAALDSIEHGVSLQLKLRERKFQAKTHDIKEAFKAAIALGFYLQVRPPTATNAVAFGIPLAM